MTDLAARFRAANERITALEATVKEFRDRCSIATSCSGPEDDPYFELEQLLYVKTTLEAELSEAKRALEKATDHKDMSWSCLVMIRETLNALGVDTTHVPPMMFPEAIKSLVAKALAAQPVEQPFTPELCEPPLDPPMDLSKFRKTRGEKP